MSEQADVSCSDRSTAGYNRMDACVQQCRDRVRDRDAGAGARRAQAIQTDRHCRAHDLRRERLADRRRTPSQGSERKLRGIGRLEALVDARAETARHAVYGVVPFEGTIDDGTRSCHLLARRGGDLDRRPMPGNGEDRRRAGHFP